MRNLIAIPLLGLAVIVQASFGGRLSLLNGFVDVVLVVITAWSLQPRVETGFHWALLASVLTSIASNLPWFIYVLGYGGTVVLALLLQRRVWQVPMLAMFVLVFLGTVLLHGLSIAYLEFSGIRVVLGDILGLITLPSLLLNLLISIPVFAMMRDVANWVAPGPEGI